jgi:hypothetical protein
MTKITRGRCRGYRGYTWVYTVHAPDGSGLCDTMVGTGVGWAREAARRAIEDGRSTGPVVESWRKSAKA